MRTFGAVEGDSRSQGRRAVPHPGLMYASTSPRRAASAVRSESSLRSGSWTPRASFVEYPGPLLLAAKRACDRLPLR